ncbi:hypothetical protein H7J70_20555 [Mycolicibacterium celeriflavum]|nr:CocE/NonD family hydrolase C-terminal non-catalytic domain-containing protein [Mycolicibacterium celeriflavum]MCV7240486.1 hypothetical protein [Mycolicibacterium celeriflavum]
MSRVNRSGTADRPVQAHQRDLPLPVGAPVRLDIEILLFTAYFNCGETLRLTVAGADIYRWPVQHLVNGHDLLNNTAAHVLHTGADYPSVLNLPILTGAARNASRRWAR